MNIEIKYHQDNIVSVECKEIGLYNEITENKLESILNQLRGIEKWPNSINVITAIGNIQTIKIISAIYANYLIM